MKERIYTALVVSALIGFTGTVFGQESAKAILAQDTVVEESGLVELEERVLLVSTIERPPFVIEKKNELVGFSIELWEEIALRTDLDFEYKLAESFGDMLSHVKTGQSDLAVANITITAERERDMDFSLPMYNSGLQIVLPNTTDLFSVWKPLRDEQVWSVLVPLLVVWLLALHVLWFAGRRTHVLFRNKYPRGLVDAFLWLVFRELQKDVPHTTSFQFSAAFLRVYSVVSLFLVTAVFASYLTIDHLRSDVVVYQDLFGKQVGVTAGSTPEKFMRQQNIPTRGYAHLDTMKADLLSGELDAIILDAPVAQYYAKTDGAGRVELVPGIFKPEQFGILFTDGNNNREKVNNALLDMQEDGTYEEIYSKWF